MAGPPTDEAGRFVWTVTWGRPGRADWRAALVLAYDPDEASVVAADAQPDRMRPQEAFLADDTTARAVLLRKGNADPAAAPITLPGLTRPAEPALGRGRNAALSVHKLVGGGRLGQALVTSLLRNWAGYFLPVLVIVLAERRLRHGRR
ncbi:MAG: hypothetical protein KY443_00355 [Actinobacteria bacterium]|nr:hypothetical protein [Actinomycetota bacterium]